MIPLKTASVIPTPTDTTWGQVHIGDGLFLLVLLEKDGDVNLPAFGKELFIAADEVFNAGQKKNLALLGEIVKTVQEKTTDANIISLVAALVVGKALYVGSLRGQMLLARQGKVAKILHGQDEIVTASGFLKEGDTVVLMSNVEIDKDILALPNPQEIAEALSALAHKGEDGKDLIAAIFSAKQAPVLPQEESIVEEKPVPLENRAWASEVRKLFAGRFKRVMLTVFLLLILLFTASIVLGVQKRQKEKSQAQFSAAYEEAVQKYEEGMALSDLNPALSQKTLAEAGGLVEKALPEFPDEKSEERRKLLDLQKNIGEGLDSALRITVVKEASLFFDLTLIKEGAVGVRMSMLGGKIAIVDRKNGALYTLTVSEKQAVLLAGALANPTQEAIGQTAAFVVTDNGIERILLREKNRDVAIGRDEEWGSIGGLATFAGNLYLLDKDKGTIYKYLTNGEEGFAQKRNYFGPGITPDLGQARSMRIDGSVWVLFADGRISKFVQGAPQSFSLSGLDAPVSESNGFYTDEESERLYVLDTGNKRVVVAKKDGTYESQYQWDGIKDVSDIAVSEKEKKILLLAGSKIFAIDIK